MCHVPLLPGQSGSLECNRRFEAGEAGNKCSVLEFGSWGPIVLLEANVLDIREKSARPHEVEFMTALSGGTIAQVKVPL